MKKSTWLVSLALVAILGCKSKSETAAQPANNNVENTQGDKAKTGGAAPGDGGISTRENEAIYHNAPNQAEIDSIKNERAKEKKGDD